ncbi:helix-turn-helix domain-containing protein [Nocardiopsis lucentensis]|uniref:helix-turn-helix domain-containing protein n=1 Tax=Nocardiopsis lucentensis TaxID=53441 RepID=UPI0012679345|nr:helix-turn-helix transcriptional regulator [Nocardiopsis lucentensis]
MSQLRFNREKARQRRITVGLSVEQVAAHVGKSPKTVYAYEGPRDVGPPPPIRRDMEKLYGLDAGELLIVASEGAGEDDAA